MSIQVVGLGIETDALPEMHSEIIDGAHVLVGGKRQMAQFEDHPAEKIIIAGPLAEVFERIAQYDGQGKDIVVLADGDPLFYGIGARLVDEFGPESIHFLPNITSLQCAAARAKIPWHDIVTVSLHGRDDMRPLFSAMQRYDWVAVLTDDKSIPASLAQKLMDRGVEWYSMWVFENLGTDNEHFDRYSLAQAGARSFARLNIVILERTGNPEHPLRLGNTDDAYETENSLITKSAVRSAGIGALQIRSTDVIWDLGAGCGSVGIEASSIASRGEVWAVERNGSRVGMIRENRRRFGALGLEIVHGTMPNCLVDLPDPDRVFIGGGLGKGSGLLDTVCERLRPEGRIVVNSVLLGTLERTKHYFQELGWNYSITMIQAASSTGLAGDLRLEGLNPVFIIGADKPSSR